MFSSRSLRLTLATASIGAFLLITGCGASSGGGGGGPTLSLNKSTYYEGESITGFFTNAPDNAQDWLGIYTTPGGGAPTDCTSNGGSLSSFTTGRCQHY